MVLASIYHLDGTVTERLIPHHECTEEDWDHFYPLLEKEKKKFDRIHNNGDRGFQCIDWHKENLEIISGADEHEDVGLAIVFTPCNIFYEEAGIF